MTINKLFGLGTHADTPVTEEEDAAFDALANPHADAPCGPIVALTMDELRLNVARSGSISKSPRPRIH